MITKRLLAVILCVVVTISLFPTDALAAPAASTPVAASAGATKVDSAKTPTPVGVNTPSEPNTPYIIMDNHYIKFIVDRKTGGYYIMPSSVMPDLSKQASHAAFLIDGEEYVFGGDYPNAEFVIPPSLNNAGTCQAVWRVGDVAIEQYLSIVQNGEDEDSYAVYIQYISATTGECVVSQRVALDTLFGANDDIPPSGGEEQVFLAGEQSFSDMPYIYLHEGFGQQNSTFLLFDDPNITRPDSVTLAHYNTIFGGTYAPALNPNLYFYEKENDYGTTDSAVALYYNDRRIVPGNDSRVSAMVGFHDLVYNTDIDTDTPMPYIDMPTMGFQAQPSAAQNTTVQPSDLAPFAAGEYTLTVEFTGADNSLFAMVNRASDPNGVYTVSSGDFVNIDVIDNELTESALKSDYVVTGVTAIGSSENEIEFFVGEGGRGVSIYNFYFSMPEDDITISIEVAPARIVKSPYIQGDSGFGFGVLRVSSRLYVDEYSSTHLPNHRLAAGQPLLLQLEQFAQVDRYNLSGDVVTPIDVSPIAAEDIKIIGETTGKRYELGTEVQVLLDDYWGHSTLQESLNAYHGAGLLLTMPDENIIVTVDNVATSSGDVYTIDVDAPADAELVFMPAPHATADELVRFQASSAPSFKIDSVKIGTTAVNYNAENEQYTFVMPSNDVTLTVTTQPLTKRNITVTAVEGGTLDVKRMIGTEPVPAASAYPGESIMVLPMMEFGYYLSAIEISYGGTTDILDEWGTFVMPDADVTLKLITGEAPTYSIMKSVVGGTVSVTNANGEVVNATEGDYITVTASVSPGYAFKSLTARRADGTVLVDFADENDTQGFYMPAESVSISLVCTEIKYSITTALAGNGRFDDAKITVASEAVYGKKVGGTVSIRDASDYMLQSVVVTRNTSGFEVYSKVFNGGERSADFEFNMPTDDVTVTVTLKAVPYYNVTVNSAIAHPASVQAVSSGLDITRFAEGDTVSVYINDYDKLYKIRSVTAKDVDNQNVAIVALNEGLLYTFVMPSKDVAVTIATTSSGEITLNGALTSNKNRAYTGETVRVNVGWLPADQKFSALTAMPGVVFNEVVAGKEYTFAMPEGNVAVTLNVNQLATHNLVTETNGKATLEVNKESTTASKAVTGEQVRVRISGKIVEGNTFVRLVATTAAGTVAQTTDRFGTLAFTMPDENVTITLETVDTNYTITQQADPAKYTISGLAVTAKAGVTVTFTVTPDVAYKLVSVIVRVDGYNPLPLTDNGNGTYSFVMPQNDVLVSANVTQKARMPVYVEHKLHNEGSVTISCVDVDSARLPRYAMEGKRVTATVNYAPEFATQYVIRSVSVYYIDVNDDKVDIAYTLDGNVIEFDVPSGGDAFSGIFLNVDAVRPHKVTVRQNPSSGDGIGRVDVSGDGNTDGTFAVPAEVMPGAQVDVYIDRVPEGRTRPYFITGYSDIDIKEILLNKHYQFTMPEHDFELIMQSDFAEINYIYISPEAAAAADITLNNVQYGFSFGKLTPIAFEDSEVTFTAVPKPGYALNGFAVTSFYGTPVVTDNGDGSYTFIMPNANATIKLSGAAGQKPEHAITLTPPAFGASITPSKAQAREGDVVEVLVSNIPDGYTLFGVSAAGTSGTVPTRKLSQTRYSFVMPDYPVTVITSINEPPAYRVQVETQHLGVTRYSITTPGRAVAEPLTFRVGEAVEIKVEEYNTLGFVTVSGKTESGAVIPIETVTVNGVFRFIMPAEHVNLSIGWTQDAFVGYITRVGMVADGAVREYNGATVRFSTTQNNALAVTGVKVYDSANPSVTVSVTKTGENEYEFIMPKFSVTIVAESKPREYSHTIKMNGNGGNASVTLSKTKSAWHEEVTVSVTNITPGYEAKYEGSFRTVGNTEVVVTLNKKALYCLTTEEGRGSVYVNGAKTSTSAFGTTLQPVYVGDRVNISVVPPMGKRLKSLNVYADSTKLELTLNNGDGSTVSYPNGFTNSGGVNGSMEFAITSGADEMTIVPVFEDTVYNITIAEDSKGYIQLTTKTAKYGDYVTYKPVTVPDANGLVAGSAVYTKTQTGEPFNVSYTTFNMPACDLTVSVIKCEAVRYPIYFNETSNYDNTVIFEYDEDMTYQGNVVTVSPLRDNPNLDVFISQISHSGYVTSDNITYTSTTIYPEFVTHNDGSVSFTMPDRPVTVSYSAAPKKYAATLTTNALSIEGGYELPAYGRTIVSTDMSSVDAGTQLTVRSNVHYGFGHVQSIEVTGEDGIRYEITDVDTTVSGITQTTEFSFTMPTQSVSVHVEYEIYATYSTEKSFSDYNGKWKIETDFDAFAEGAPIRVKVVNDDINYWLDKVEVFELDANGIPKATPYYQTTASEFYFDAPASKTVIFATFKDAPKANMEYSLKSMYELDGIVKIIGPAKYTPGSEFSFIVENAQPENYFIDRIHMDIPATSSAQHFTYRKEIISMYETKYIVTTKDYAWHGIYASVRIDAYNPYIGVRLGRNIQPNSPFTDFFDSVFVYGTKYPNGTPTGTITDILTSVKVGSSSANMVELIGTEFEENIIFKGVHPTSIDSIRIKLTDDAGNHITGTAPAADGQPYFVQINDGDLFSFTLQTLPKQPETPYTHLAILQSGNMLFDALPAYSERDIIARRGNRSVLMTISGTFDFDSDEMAFVFAQGTKATINNMLTVDLSDPNAKLSLKINADAFEDGDTMLELSGELFSLSMPGMTFVTPELSPNFTTEFVRGNYYSTEWIYEDDNPFALQKEPVALDIRFGHVDPMLDLGYFFQAGLNDIIILKDGICFGGIIRFDVTLPGGLEADWWKGPKAGVAIERLQFGIDPVTGESTLMGLIASGEIGIPDGFLPGLSGAPEMGAAVYIDTFEKHFMIEGGVKIQGMGEVEAMLEIKEIKWLGLVGLNSIYGYFDVDAVGIPIIPPAPVMQVTGGGFGIYGLVDTLNVGEYIVPPIKLSLLVSGKMLEVIKMEKMKITIGKEFSFSAEPKLSIGGLDLELFEEYYGGIEFFDNGVRFRISTRMAIFPGLAFIAGGGTIEASCFVEKINGKLVPKFSFVGELYAVIQIPEFDVLGLFKAGPIELRGFRVYISDEKVSLSYYLIYEFYVSFTWRTGTVRAGIKGWLPIVGDFDVFAEHSLWGKKSAPLRLGVPTAYIDGNGDHLGDITIGGNITPIATSHAPTAALMVSNADSDIISDPTKPTVMSQNDKKKHTVIIPRGAQNISVIVDTSTSSVSSDMLRVTDPSGSAYPLYLAGKDADGYTYETPNMNAVEYLNSIVFALDCSKRGEWTVEADVPFEILVIEADRTPTVTANNTQYNSGGNEWNVAWTVDNLKADEEYTLELRLSEPDVMGSTAPGAQVVSLTIPRGQTNGSKTIQDTNGKDVVVSFNGSVISGTITLTQLEIDQLCIGNGEYYPSVYLFGNGNNSTLYGSSNSGIKLDYVSPNTPDAVTNVVALRGGNGTAVVTWNDANISSNAATGYYITVTNEDGTVAMGQSEDGEASPLEYMIERAETDTSFSAKLSGLTQGVPYYFTVTPFRTLMNQDNPDLITGRVKGAAVSTQTAFTITPMETLAMLLAVQGSDIIEDGEGRQSAKIKTDNDRFTLEIRSNQAADYVITYTTRLNPDDEQTTATLTGSLALDTDANGGLDHYKNVEINLAGTVDTSSRVEVRLVNASGDSTVRSFTAFVDNHAPTLMVDATMIENTSLFSLTPSYVPTVTAATNGDYTLTGTTEPFANVFDQHGNEANADVNGRFTLVGNLYERVTAFTTFSLAPQGLTITSVDRAGNSTSYFVYAQTVDLDVITEITLSPSSAQLTLGETLMLETIGTDSALNTYVLAAGDVTYTVSGDAVSVDEYGRLTTVEAGIAVVTATVVTQAGTLSATLTVTVSDSADSGNPSGPPNPPNPPKPPNPPYVPRETEEVEELEPETYGVTMTPVDGATLIVEPVVVVSEFVGGRPAFALSLDGDVTEFGRVTISIPYTPAEGENENALIAVMVANGELVVMFGRYDREAGAVVFETDTMGTFAIAYNPVSFIDVGAGDWFKDAVDFIAARGITQGVGDNRYDPQGGMTRAMFLVMLMRMYGIAPETGENFADAGNDYYTGYLSSAKRLGISNGIGNDLFAPDRLITREEMMAFLSRALQCLDRIPDIKEGTRDIADYSDAELLSEWARKSTEMLVKAGIIQGSNGRLTPKDNLTRAEAAQVIFNLISLK